MGRRKIEIQPITHERNRSVTFLKRKNGLFKKAYELGVLCSVEVAVIIFEEKPGHNPKLYQYGSDDIKAIVQRHIRFEGEKDTKSPSDFSHAKPDELEDDDDQDEEDTAKSKKRADPVKSKPKVDKLVAASTSRATDTDDEHQPSTSRVRRSPPPQIATLPTSGERHPKHTPEHDDYPPAKRIRTNSEDLRASEARNLFAHPGLHSLHALASQQPYNLPVASSHYNHLFGPGMGAQSPQLFDFLRNPNNLRALSAYTQPGMYPRVPPGVSDGFLQSLSELAAQQSSGIGCGVGGVGAGISGFEWPGYPSGPPHHSEQGPEPSWLDFLTSVPGNIPPPAHLPYPHSQNRHAWPSPSSHRSDSSSSDFDTTLGEVLPPRLGIPIRPPSRDIDTGDIF